MRQQEVKIARMDQRVQGLDQRVQQIQQLLNKAKQDRNDAIKKKEMALKRCQELDKAKKKMNKQAKLKYVQQLQGIAQAAVELVATASSFGSVSPTPTDDVLSPSSPISSSSPSSPSPMSPPAPESSSIPAPESSLIPTPVSSSIPAPESSLIPALTPPPAVADPLVPSLVIPPVAPMPPFKFVRELNRVRDVWDEILRFKEYKLRDKFLGYSRTKEGYTQYRSEMHYINKRLYLEKEIQWIQSHYNNSLQGALLQASVEMHDSGLGHGRTTMASYLDQLKTPRHVREARAADVANRLEQIGLNADDIYDD
jgi:hypothetical protein